MIARQITPKDYNLILELDKKVYPTSKPVTKEVIASWYIRNPEFGMIFCENGKIEGVFVVIPLNKESWNRLINGNLKEAEMTDKTIFDNLKDKEIGIHIYHTEKFNQNIKDFYKYNFEELDKIIKILRSKNKNLKIFGISAYSVSPPGIGLRTKLDFKERSFISDEHILDKDKKLIVAESTKQAEDLKIKGYKYINRCQMKVLYPNEDSIVWNYLNKI